MGRHSIRSNLVVCLVLLVTFLVQVPDLAAHTLDHVGVEAPVAVEATSQPSTSHQVSPLHPLGHYQHSDNDGSSHTGSCCVVGCSASGLPAYAPSAPTTFASERSAPAPVTPAQIGRASWRARVGKSV